MQRASLDDPTRASFPHLYTPLLDVDLEAGRAMPPPYANGPENCASPYPVPSISPSLRDGRAPTPIDQTAVARSSGTSQHDSVIDSAWPRKPSGQAQPKAAMQSDIRLTEFFLRDAAAEEAWALGGRTPMSALHAIPPRNDSIPYLQPATSPLAQAVPLEEDVSNGSVSPPLRASDNSFSSLRGDLWLRTENGRGSMTRATDSRSSAGSSVAGHRISPTGTGASRLRGMTGNSPNKPWPYTPSLQHSTSIPDLAALRDSNRALPTGMHKRPRGPSALRDSAQSSLRREPFTAPFADENRASVRSGWTATSSGFLGSERSSVVSRSSSVNDLPSRDTRHVDELILSVEDAINMYANGFTDDLPEDVGSDMPKNDQVSPRTPDPPAASLSRERVVALLRTDTAYESTRIRDDFVPAVPSLPAEHIVNEPPMDQRTSMPPKIPSNQNDPPSPPVESISASESTMHATPRTLHDQKFSQIPGEPYELKFTLPTDSTDMFLSTGSSPSPVAPASRVTSSAPLQTTSSYPRPGSEGVPPLKSSSDSPDSSAQQQMRSPKDSVPIRRTLVRSASSPADLIPPPSEKRLVDPELIPSAEHDDDDESMLFPTPTLMIMPSAPLPMASDVQRRQTAGVGDFVYTRSAPVPPPPAASRDRYGFKKASQYISEDQYDEWDEGYSGYLDRRKVKWDALMRHNGLPTESPLRFPPKSERVKRYIRKGIPPQWRGAAWFWYAGGPSKIVQHSGLYQKLMRDINVGLLNESDREHIERDLNRTFPDNVRFKPDPSRRSGPTGELEDVVEAAETPIIKALRRVLQAFAVHNPGIGYCQSLNFLAGLLLLFMDENEEHAFIMLNIITTLHLPGTHAKVLEASVDIGVLMACIKESMPAVWAKIDDSSEDGSAKASGSLARLPTVSLATTAWFMSCYIGNLPIEAVLRVWDAFFYEGSKTLFRVALAIFKTAEDDIRNVAENMEVFQLVQTIPRRMLDANGLMRACFKRRGGFANVSQDLIDKARVERRRALADARARKMGAKSATQANGVVDFEQRDLDGGRGLGRLRRAATRARMMKGSKSRKRAPVSKESITMVGPVARS